MTKGLAPKPPSEADVLTAIQEARDAWRAGLAAQVRLFELKELVHCMERTLSPAERTAWRARHKGAIMRVDPYVGATLAKNDAVRAVALFLASGADVSPPALATIRAYLAECDDVPA
jgi:hypothetical protein